MLNILIFDSPAFIREYDFSKILKSSKLYTYTYMYIPRVYLQPFPNFHCFCSLINDFYLELLLLLK